MPTTRRSRTLAADQAAVWAVVGDPHHLARWWPRVERVEQVTAGQFTEVLRSERGRTVRADQRLTELVAGERIGWVQELAGTPFEQVLAYGSTTVILGPAAGGGGGTNVRIERVQRMRGAARFGGLIIRRATGRVLVSALDGLAATLSVA